MQDQTTRSIEQSSRDAERPGHSLVDSITHFIHRHFLLFLISAYVLAAFLPELGLWLRHLHLGRVSLGTEKVDITLSLVMLSFLLFNAGLGIRAKQLVGLWSHPTVIGLGFLANIIVPIVLVCGLRQAMGLWHSSDEVQSLLVGLALIVAMPIAGSSTAWSQNANGNLGLSLGLIFLSTMLSPFTGPIVLKLFSGITSGDYSEDLAEIATQGTNTFLLISVVLPSLLGIILHFVLKDKRVNALRSHLKLSNFVVLLLLNYSNASVSLPHVVRFPDWDFLALIVTVTVALCVVAFGAGWALARWLKVDKADMASLMFGLGMNNNGTGLVLASQTLADHPNVFLPLIFYTLAQQIVAALVDRKFFRADDE